MINHEIQILECLIHATCPPPLSFTKIRMARCTKQKEIHWCQNNWFFQGFSDLLKKYNFSYSGFLNSFGKFSFKSTPISFCQKKIISPCWPRVPGHRMPPHHSCCAVFAPLPFFSGIHLVPPIASKNITHSMPNILAVCKIVWTNVVVCFCLFQPMKSQQAGRHFPFVVCTRVSHVVAGCNMNLSDTTSPEATPQKQQKRSGESFGGSQLNLSATWWKWCVAPNKWGAEEKVEKVEKEKIMCTKWPHKTLVTIEYKAEVPGSYWYSNWTSRGCYSHRFS